MKIQTTFCRIFRERLPEKTTFKVEYEFWKTDKEQGSREDCLRKRK